MDNLETKSTSETRPSVTLSASESPTELPSSAGYQDLGIDSPGPKSRLPSPIPSISSSIYAISLV
jgi:hypothetical protein